MRYFLKLAKVNNGTALNSGWYEEVDEFTYKNAKFALCEEGTGPRYTKDGVIVDGDEISVKLDTVPLRDLAVLTRYFQALEPLKVDGGFVREQPNIRFLIRGRIKLREKNGTVWSQDNPVKAAA